MTPTTAAGRALLADYPGLAGLEYGRTGEFIVLAIEAEARADLLARLRAELAIRIEEATAFGRDERVSAFRAVMDDLDGVRP